MNNLKIFFEKDWSKVEKMLLLVNCILGGMVIGILFSPLKGGITVHSNNSRAKEDEK